MPFAKVTCQVNVPLPLTGVFLLTPGPVRWKSWVFAMSLTTIVYLPAFSFVTFFPPFVSVMWNAPSGPVEPTRRGADMAEALEASAVAARAVTRVTTMRVNSAPSSQRIETPER